MIDSDGSKTHMVQTVFSIVLIVLSVLLVGAILLQARGAGLGAAFGGEGNVFRTKRGVERVLFRATVVISILFFGTALASAVLS